MLLEHSTVETHPKINLLFHLLLCLEAGTQADLELLVSNDPSASNFS